MQNTARRTSNNGSPEPSGTDWVRSGPVQDEYEFAESLNYEVVNKTLFPKTYIQSPPLKMCYLKEKNPLNMSVKMNL